MTNPIRIALLGLGQRGLQHLKAIWRLQEEGQVQIVALGDAFAENLTAGKLQQYVPGFQPAHITHSTNFDALLNEKPDAVYICIPPNVHNGEVLRAARAGVHLFVEKPMSLFLDEALEMAQTIREAGVLSVVGFQQRFDVRHEVIKDLVAGQKAVLASYTIHAPLEGHNVKHTKTEETGGPSNRVWTANRAWSGMTVVEAGIHPLDLWRFWFGDIVWVRANYVHRPPEEIFDGADNPYAYSATFGFANGAIGNMLLSRLRRVYQTYVDHQVLLNESRIVLGRGVTQLHYDGPYPPSQTPPADAVQHDIALPPTKETTYEIARSFVEAIRTNQPDLIRSPFDDAMNSLAAVIGANVSDELGGALVKLDDLLTAEEFARFRKRPG